MKMLIFLLTLLNRLKALGNISEFKMQIVYTAVLF